MILPFTLTSSNVKTSLSPQKHKHRFFYLTSISLIIFLWLIQVVSTYAQPNFTEKSISTSANGARSVFAADVDGDGDMDMLSASEFDNKIAWYENDGNQNFTEKSISTSALNAYSVFAADVDGDGDMDVLSASFEDDKIAWYENDGAQNFTEKSISTIADGAISVYATDVDGDGDMDVLSASVNDDKIAWYENDGTQNFTERIISTTADGAYSVFAADMDGDGDMDVLSASQSDDKIAWYENDGAQNFTERIISTAADRGRSVFAADVDGDGDMDVLSASLSDDKIAWYENDGMQNFTEKIISTSASTGSVYAADIDGDGDMDVLSAYFFGHRIVWFENDGMQNFTEKIISTSAEGANSVFAADVDGDGDMDVLSASFSDDKIAWYKNDVAPPGAACFATNEISTSADGAVSVYAADVDRDGDMDVLSASFSDDKIVWYENNGSQSFTEKSISTSASGPQSVYATDMDGDGDMDVLGASVFDGKIAWYENNGTQNFTERTISTTEDQPRNVFAADVDGDGDMDVLSATENEDKIAWFENDGTQNFSERVISTTADGTRSVFAADVDGDGDMDVLSASVHNDKIAWYENNGAQSFSEKIISTTADAAYSVYAADVDGDGDMDVLSASQNDDKIAWYDNDGTQNFSEKSISTSADGARSVYAADVDGDGDMDVLSASFEDDKIVWYENDGTQNFTEKSISTSADGANSVFAADVDGDGDLDVLSASLSDDKIAWYENVDLSITTVSASTTDGTYKAGGKIEVTLTFCSTVTVTGTPQLELETGDTDRKVNYTSGSGTNTLTFTYTVQAGDMSNDLDYKATTSLELNGGTIKGSGGTNASLTLPAPGATNSLGANKALVIDTKNPTVTVNIVDAPLSNSDNSSSVNFTFSEVVTGFDATDLTVVGGMISGFNGSGNTYTATFTANDNSTTTGSVTVKANSYTDAAGNNGATGSDNVTIDTKNPTVTVNIVDASLSDSDNSSNVIFTFSEAVTGFAATDLTVVGGMISGFSGSGNTYTATFTATDNSTTTGSVTVKASSYTDVAGNNGATGSDNVTIDTKNPTVMVNIVDASLSNSDNSSSVNFTFSEVVTGFDATDLTVVGGMISGFSGSGNTYTATFTANDNSTTTGSVTVKANSYTNAAGNTGAAGSDNVTIDTKNPTVTVNIVDASLSDSDNSSSVTFTFSEAVTGFDAADLTVVGGMISGFSGSGNTYTATFTANDNSTTTGSVTVKANSYTDLAGNNGATGSDNVTIDTKNPTVMVNIVDASLSDSDNSSSVNFTFSEVVTGFDATDLTVVGGMISGFSGSGNTYTATFTANDNSTTTGSVTVKANSYTDVVGNTGATGSDNVTIDTKNPTVTINQATGQADPTNSTTINYTVVFSESITNFATGDVTLSGTAGATTATVTGGGTNYNVAVTGMTTSGTVIVSIPANKATDAAGNGNTASTSTDNEVNFDNVKPTVTINQASGQADPTNSTTINYTVVFSESTTNFATGDVTLSGTAGATTATVTGSGTTYNVAVTGMTTSGTVIATIAANKATDAVGNGNTASTSTDNEVVYDKDAPTITTLSPADNATEQATNTNLVITFSENVKKGTGNITIHKKSDNSTVETIAVTNSIVSISGATVTINPANNLAVNTEYYINIPNTAFTDMVGNAYTGITDATTWRFKTISRTITLSAVANSPKAENATGTIDFTFTADAAPTSNLPINYTIGGTATNGTDYVMLSGMVTLPANMTTVKVSVNPTGDTTIEPDETIILTVATGANYAIGTTKTQTAMISNDDFCPTMGTLMDPADICQGSTVNLSIAGLDKMASVNNGDQDFGIKFVAFTAATTNPYSGGTSLGTVPLANLTGSSPNQTATLNNVGNTLAVGTYTIYAILSPTPTNATCRTSKNISLTVKPTPTITFVADNNNVICGGTDVTFTATGGTSYNFLINNVSKQDGATATFTTNALAQEDKVKVTVTDAQNCTTTSTEYTAQVNSTDSDNDSVPDCRDVCPGGNDLGPDLDKDNVPDVCDCDPDDNNDAIGTAPTILGQLTTGEYKAGLDLTADAAVNSDNSVILRGGRSVILAAGFEARLGSEVHALIAPCVGPSTLLENGQVVAKSTIALPYELALINTNLTIAPNPFRGQTNLNFVLPQAERASVALFDQSGKQLRYLLRPKTLEAGDYNIRLTDEDLQAGMYFVVLQTATERITKKLIRVR